MKHFLDVSPPGCPPYPVFIGEDSDTICAQLLELWQPGWKHAVVIADDNTRELFAEHIAAALANVDATVLTCCFSPGEHSKTRTTKAMIEDRMLRAGVDRGACVVAVGGGIVLDTAGFVAATYMRGIAHINVATTLLAQVDAAVGGKTAINTEHGKNLIGSIHHPRAVLLHTEALTSLPDVELRCGLAEAVKHAVLSDAALFDQLGAWAKVRSCLRPPHDILTRCVAIKAEVVASDDRDRGRRNILNYGHTVAHAIELATDHEVLHGQAVAIGMVIESRLAMQAGRFPAVDLDRLVALLQDIGLPTQSPCAYEAASAYFVRDKKTVAGEIRCAIPQRIGHTAAEANGSWTRGATHEQLRAAWSP